MLDEPTAGVDVELRQTLWQFIRRLNGEGRTIVLTTHYLEEAQQLCSRIAMLKQGRIIAMDTTDHLLSAFAERVLRIKSEAPLPAAVAAEARKSEGAWHAFPLHDTGEVESRLRWLREAGVTVAAIEVSEPDLEDVFVKLMRK